MIALITPTGGRPKQIRLCAEWMKKQTYKGEVLWVLVDDVAPITTDFINDDFKENWKIVRLFPRPRWEEGQNTQKRNLLVGVREVEKYDNVQSVFIIEDDDYYFPYYLEKMVQKLGRYSVAGQVKTLYFNIIDGVLKRHKNTHHSSLFQTAFKIDQLPVFKNVLLSDIDVFIDIHFWNSVGHKRINLFNSTDLSIGIKGLPGRKGIGIGHKVKRNKLEKSQIIQELQSLIGDDYLNYIQ